mmetsp:Transcript_5154/g.10107  ORF Transcript_5154/g.10107 Transcript_5154/m.10107 type:complete len:243 (-) Transcript_5154:202-930(-)
MLLAKSSGAAAQLQEAMSSKECVKRYRGVVNGVVNGNARQEGCWNKPLTNKAEGRRNPQGKSADRVSASTAYRVVAGSRFLSVLDFELGSGRTHQIRKHCAMSGHHLLGDTRYGPLAHAKKIAARYGFDGMALHAASLRVPLDGELRDFDTPPPAAWAPLLEPFGSLPGTAGGEIRLPPADSVALAMQKVKKRKAASSPELEEAMAEAMADKPQARSPEEVARALERFAALKVAALEGTKRG